MGKNTVISAKSGRRAAKLTNETPLKIVQCYLQQNKKKILTL